MSLFRREVRQWTAEPYVPPFPGATAAGYGVPSIESALSVSAVWACVRLVADTVSMLDLNAYTMKNGVRVPIDNPPLLTSPSSDANISEWLDMLVSAAMLRGNAVGRVVQRDSLGYPKQIEWNAPDRVTIRPDSTGNLTYSVNGVTIPRQDVFHFRAYRLPGLSIGLSPIQYAAMSINREKAIQQFSLGYFLDAPHPQAVITSDQTINDEQARTLKERILARVVGREPLVLGAGAKWQTLSVTPEESQFLETQKLGISEIARIYRVPPEMIAAEVGNSMTYANVEQRAIDFLTYTIQPWLTKIEQALSAIMPGGKHVRFDTSNLLRTDMLTLMNATAIGIASKQMTPDEARAKRDEPPLTDEQKSLLALVPMDVGATGKPKLLPAPPTNELVPGGEPA